MSSRILLASLFSVAALAACGGGGDGGPVTPTPSAAASPAPAPAIAPGPAAQTGSVSAPFVAGANPMVARISVYGQQIGVLSNFTQAAGGAVTTINELTLGAPTTVRDINGDATFAMGRWTAGTVAGASSPQTLIEAGNAAYHYVLFNKPASLPSSGSLTCDSGTFTTPTYNGGTNVSSNSDLWGRVTGSAQISFSSSGAAVQMALTVSNSVSSGPNNFSTVIAPSSGSSFAGHSIGAGQPGAWVAVGASGTGYDVVGGYLANTTSGTGYTGVYRFHCK